MSSSISTTSIFILAAGRGERMRPLTDHTPKPLLTINNKSLIVHHLENIAKQGFKDVVINIAHLSEQITNTIGNGNQFGLNIQYSDESNSGALETAGGIRNALDLIKHPYFICLNADVWTDFDYSTLIKQHNGNFSETHEATIVLVKNPAHNLNGDFLFNHTTGLVERITQSDLNTDNVSFTFSGIGLYQKKSFSSLPIKKQALGPLLRQWADQKKLIGTIHSGSWHDIGTPERLKEINQGMTT